MVKYCNHQPAQRMTEHKRFVPYGIYLCLRVGTSPNFVSPLGTFVPALRVIAFGDDGDTYSLHAIGLRREKY